MSEKELTVLSSEIRKGSRNLRTRRLNPLNGGYTFQVLSFALKNIEELTKSKPKYVLEVIKTFRLDEYLVIPEYIYQLAED